MAEDGSSDRTKLPMGKTAGRPIHPNPPRPWGCGGRCVGKRSRRLVTTESSPGGGDGLGLENPDGCMGHPFEVDPPDRVLARRGRAPPSKASVVAYRLTQSDEPSGESKGAPGRTQCSKPTVECPLPKCSRTSHHRPVEKKKVFSAGRTVPTVRSPLNKRGFRPVVAVPVGAVSCERKCLRSGPSGPPFLQPLRP